MAFYQGPGVPGQSLPCSSADRKQWPDCYNGGQATRERARTFFSFIRDVFIAFWGGRSSYKGILHSSTLHLNPERFNRRGQAQPHSENE